jgi:hypothetical protein
MQRLDGTKMLSPVRSAPPIRAELAGYPAVLWWSLWFWLGTRPAVALLLREDLYTASVVSSLITVTLALLFALFALGKPSHVRARTGIWAGVYYAITTVSSLASPFITSENFLRVFGLLASSASVTFALVVYFNRTSSLSALKLAAQGYVPGILLMTLVLVASNPSLLAFREMAWRFGDPDVLHPNVLGAAFGAGLLALVFLPVYPFLVRYGLAMLIGIALLATVSKTSIAATAIGLVSGWFLLRGIRKLSLSLVLSFGGIVGSLVVGNFVLDQVEAYFSDPYLSSTLSGRTVLWDFVLRLVAERPVLGYGFAVLKDVMLPYAPSLGWRLAVQAHNAYVDVLFSSGYVGLAVFAALLLRIMYFLVVSIRILRDNTPSAFLAALTMFLLVRSVTEGTLNLGPDFAMLMTVALAAENVVYHKRLSLSSGASLLVPYSLSVGRR